MTHPLEQLRDEALRKIGSASDEQALEAARVKYLGRSGSISAWGEQMKTFPKAEKPVVGKLLNEVRTAVTAAIETRGQQFQSQKESGALAKIDISLPGTPHELGTLHPLTQMWDRSIEIFRRMGFALADGPDIEDEWHCFDALNTPLRTSRAQRTHFISPTVDCSNPRRPCKSAPCKPRHRRFA
jgi:phenylalanyl-tRNA synthetase alpha chain